MIKRRTGDDAEGRAAEVGGAAAAQSSEEENGTAEPRQGNAGGEDGAATPAAAAELAGHPYDFHVSGPRNLSSPNWRDLIRSSWKDPNYKRMVIACFVQAVYLLELDRQEQRTEENGLAAKWWKPFKYRLAETLVDGRDGSIYGAILEWDRIAALSDFVLMRPSGAPRAVLALRGTVLKGQTIRRDLQDDLRFFAWESLKGSVRFGGALAALKSAVNRFGSGNVCVGGHSLGAGFALQVGKALAKEGVFVECHLFNPPSVSLAMSLRVMGEKAGALWRRIKAAMPANCEVVVAPETDAANASSAAGRKRWVPHLYVNNSDYICCYYNDTDGTVAAADAAAVAPEEAKTKPNQVAVVAGAAKLFVVSAKGPQKFLEAHGLQQWWSDDMELQVALHQSKLIDRQLRSLYAAPPAAAAQAKS